MALLHQTPTRYPSANRGTSFSLAKEKKKSCHGDIDIEKASVSLSVYV
jgi:hypothetical protein